MAGSGRPTADAKEGLQQLRVTYVTVAQQGQQAPVEE